MEINDEFNLDTKDVSVMVKNARKHTLMRNVIVSFIVALVVVTAGLILYEPLKNKWTSMSINWTSPYYKNMQFNANLVGGEVAEAAGPKEMVKVNLKAGQTVDITEVQWATSGLPTQPAVSFSLVQTHGFRTDGYSPDFENNSITGAYTKKEAHIELKSGEIKPGTYYVTMTNNTADTIILAASVTVQK